MQLSHTIIVRNLIGRHQCEISCFVECHIDSHLCIVYDAYIDIDLCEAVYGTF